MFYSEFILYQEVCVKDQHFIFIRNYQVSQGKWICIKEKSITQHVLTDRLAAGFLFSLEIRVGVGTVTSYQNKGGCLLFSGLCIFSVF